MPPATTTAPRAQTSRQAKAAYKSRGNPILTEREQKQVDRSIELDKRAWRSREVDKKKAEASKKRLEKEKGDREARERAAIGTQRLYDRHGYKSSQMHLGAFLGRKPAGRTEPAVASTVESQTQSEAFDEDGMDDESLLEAFDNTSQDRNQSTGKQTCVLIGPERNPLSRPMHTPSQLAKTPAAPPPTNDDLESFWVELDSSTQIARDLDMTDACQPSASQGPAASDRSNSFGSDDFDVSVEDLEGAPEPPPPPREPSKTATDDRKLMPPPAPPSKQAMPPPALPRTHSMPHPAQAQKQPMPPPALTRTHSMASPAVPRKQSMAPPTLPTKHPLPPPAPRPPKKPNRLKTKSEPLLFRAGAATAAAAPVRPLQKLYTPGTPTSWGHDFQPAGRMLLKPPQPGAGGVGYGCVQPVGRVAGVGGHEAGMRRQVEGGWSLSQLEQFVDDDLQLTQAGPG